MSRRRHEGFTLVELLVAITVFSIIAMGIYQTMRLGLGTWERTNLLMRQNRSLRAFFNGLSGDLVNSVPASSVVAGTLMLESDGMTFPAIRPGGITQVRYRFDKGSGNIYRSYAGLKEGFDMKLAAEKVILSGAEDAVFGYAANLTEDKGAVVWEKGWNGIFGQALPGAARVGVTLKNGAGIPGEKFEKMIRIPSAYSTENKSVGGAA